jgi:hypothetical protein
MEEFMRWLLDMRSMTVIRYKLEDQLELGTHTEADVELLKRMREMNKLDDLWIAAHERLGNQEEADHIRAWMAHTKHEREMANAQARKEMLDD